MKKNKVFVNKIEKKIGNNQSYYDIKDITNNSYEIDNDFKKEIISDDNLSIYEKIDNLFKRNGYIFNVDVKIITNKKEYDTKIAGKMNNHLITLDNDIINISDIKDIIIKTN